MKDFNIVEDVMKNSNNTDLKRKIDFIKDIVAHFYGETKEVYDNKSRKHNIIKTRHVAVYICAINLKVRLVELAHYFNISHCLIIHIKKNYDGYLKFDADLRKEFAEIENILSFRLASELNLEKENYYIPLNEFVSMKDEENKAIIFKGFTDEEINNIRIANKNTNETMFKPVSAKKHKNQKFYILEKNKDEKNNNFS